MEENRDELFASLRKKMERVGFSLERQQKPRQQSGRKKELKFIHRSLEATFSSNGLKNTPQKYYIKPLSDGLDGVIGLTTGKSSALLNGAFTQPNTVDTFDNCPAWINDGSSNALDMLLASIYVYLDEEEFQTLDNLQDRFNEQVTLAAAADSEVRRKRIKNAPSIPEKVTTTIEMFKRNPDVVAEVLIRAEGVCEICRCNAPFVRKKDGTPYLEVHHVEQLSMGGEDTIENAVAICPNCHRKEHFGL